MDATATSATAAEPDALRWVNSTGAGVVVATFCGYDAADRFLVRADGDAAPQAALSTLALRERDLGCRVVLAFEGGDLRRPIVVGRLQARERAGDDGVLRIDAERLRLEAGREIELRCGEASIVLTRAGKVLIRGAYVSSRSKGANRIKGAHVDIN